MREEVNDNYLTVEMASSLRNVRVTFHQKMSSTTIEEKKTDGELYNASGLGKQLIHSGGGCSTV